MKIFKCYTEDLCGVDVYVIPAETKEDAINRIGPDIDVIACKDVTEKYPIDIDRLVDDLRFARWSDNEIKIITRILMYSGIHII